MNKIQWTAIILSAIGLVLYFGFGIPRPLTHWINIIVYIIGATVLVLFFYLAFKPRHCAKCGARLPRIRKPQNKRQALYGGWTCPKCKSELDSSGNLVK